LNSTIDVWPFGNQALMKTERETKRWICKHPEVVLIASINQSVFCWIQLKPLAVWVNEFIFDPLQIPPIMKCTTIQVSKRQMDEWG
jgi:hypothetical protein